MRRIIAAAALAIAVLIFNLPAPATQAQPACRFVLGFATLRDLIGADKVGGCLEDEHFNLENGNAEQHTAGGLMVWRKVDNFTAFTDGGTSWVNGPNGLQTRPNGERFSWEKDPIASARTQAAPSSSSSSAGGLPPSPAPTATPQQSTTTAEIPPLRSVRVDPTATPPVTSRQSSDSLTFKGLTVKVLKIERGWKSDNQFTKPKDGNEFITMDVRIDNDTDEHQEMNPARFKVVTEDGARWDRRSARDPYLRLGDVIPGTPMRGWLTFEVPKRQAVIQLLWEADYATTLVLPING